MNIKKTSINVFFVPSSPNFQPVFNSLFPNLALRWVSLGSRFQYEMGHIPEISHQKIPLIDKISKVLREILGCFFYFQVCKKKWFFVGFQSQAKNTDPIRQNPYKFPSKNPELSVMEFEIPEKSHPKPSSANF